MNAPRGSREARTRRGRRTGMFIGHFAVALAAKRAAPRTSLGTLVAAAQLIDLVWPVLVLAGVEVVRVDPGNTPFTPLDFVSYPWTHSAATVVVWSALFVALALLVARFAAVVAAAVASHWVLDLVSHRPDLPLFPGGPKVGLGLWESVPGTLVVETGLFLAGAVLYATATRARDRAGRIGLAALVAVLLLIYLANVLSPAPPSPTAVAGGALLVWLFVPWAAWVDRHRALAAAPALGPPPIA